MSKTDEVPLLMTLLSYGGAKNQCKPVSKNEDWPLLVHIKPMQSIKIS